MDKELHAQLSVAWNYLSIPKLWDWMTDNIPQFIIDVVTFTYPWWDLS